MSKKYLSIEEAASHIGISTAELNRLREKGNIRAFADRGTWKFKEEDVHKLARSRQTDSDPDVPLQAAEEPLSELVFSDDDLTGGEPTIIRTGRDDDSGSDSDVRLIFDDTLNVPEPKSGAPAEDSDSDVKLAGGIPVAAKPGSDSDVKLVTDIEATEPTGSDSDVQLVSSDSSGDVKIVESGSGLHSVLDAGTAPDSVIQGGSTINLVPAAEGSSISGDDGSVIEDDSGISLAEGSGISLASDSGISLERPNDSGISLAEESSIVLAGDSGISLAQDSGISLAPESPVVKAGGKGKPKGKPSKSPADSDDLTGTIPLMDVPGADSEDILDTQMEVPMLGDSSDETGVVGGSRGDATSVITLDEDEDQDYAFASGKRGAPDATDEHDLFASDEAVVEDVEEAVDIVGDEVIGEDDELGEDVFGAEDEDFGDVEAGSSSADLPVSPRVAAPVEQDWGAPTFAGLVLSAVLLVACGTVMFDLVRNMWHTDAARQNPVSSMLLDTFKGI